MALQNGFGQGLDKESLYGKSPSSGLGDIFSTPSEPTDAQKAAVSRGIASGQRSGARASGFMGGQIDKDTKNVREGMDGDTAAAAPTPSPSNDGGGYVRSRNWGVQAERNKSYIQGLNAVGLDYSGDFGEGGFGRYVEGLSSADRARAESVFAPIDQRYGLAPASPQMARPQAAWPDTSSAAAPQRSWGVDVQGNQQRVAALSGAGINYTGNFGGGAFNNFIANLPQAERDRANAALNSSFGIQPTQASIPGIQAAPAPAPAAAPVPAPVAAPAPAQPQISATDVQSMIDAAAYEQRRQEIIRQSTPQLFNPQAGGWGMISTK